MKKLSKTKKIIMNKNIKKIIKQIDIKIFKIGFLILLGLFILRESYGIYIDKYNFEQLEKAKPYLETIGENDERFFSLNEFNERYNSDIKPIRNCYYVSNYNGNEKYIFGFKLESLFNIFKYNKNYFAYPRYDIPYGKRIYYDDYNLFLFKDTISNKCKGSVSGYIYRDENKNGIRDNGEVGFEGLEVCSFGRCLKTGKTGYYNFSTTSGKIDIKVTKYYKDNLTITYPIEEKYDIFLNDGEIIKNLDFGIYN